MAETEKTTKSAKDLETLLEIARAMSAEKDIDNLLQLIMREATRLVGADRSTLFMVDERRNELYSRIAQKSEITEIRVPLGKGIVGHVTGTGEVVNIKDAYCDNRFNPEVDKRTGFRTRNILCAPLRTYDDKVIGAIQILNKRDGGFTDYDENLILALGSHAAVALDNARLVQHYVEKQKLLQSLEIARQIQQGLLPKAVPEIAGFEFAGMSSPCDETGGDYYDYVPVGKERMGVIVGDVSGHGIGSALLMASTRAALRALAIDTVDPAAIMFQLNKLMSQDVGSSQFVTLFFGVIDPRERRLTYTSAGHDNPLLYRPGSGEFFEMESTGMPLGIIDDTDFPCGPDFGFEPGDVLLLTTDGVWEAMDPERQSFGRDRLKALLKERCARSATEIMAAIFDAVKSFCSSAKQQDDITMMVVKCTGKGK
ncbi:MAG: SpoIIE family protein phosphatase [Planctomycetota bacterium]|nr:SpoIIE family protein phosphatase [Planctomycetota bacterium]